MWRKLVLITFLIFALVCILSTPFQVKIVEASGTIYIRADGSVDPDTAPISSDDNITYTFTDNINDSIVVEKDKIVVDGAGYTLQGPGAGVYGSKGIDLTGRSNVTTKNMEIKAFEFGIFLWESSNNSISGNTLTNNGGGIYLWQSSKNTLSSNVMNDNNHNFGVAGGELHHYLHNVDISNLVDGNPVYYWVNQHGAEIPLDAGYVALVNSTEITVKDLTLTNNREGLLLVTTQNSHIVNNTLTNNGYGIVLCQSSSNSISGNNITTNNYYGISLTNSPSNSIFGNSITANNLHGIHLEFSSSYNSISGNNIKNNDYGIFSWASSSYNSISGNNIKNNFIGIFLTEPSNNSVYHNNFMYNLGHVNIPISGYNISYANWDDGYPSGGNYWSDYDGTDTNGDGIGDTPYVILSVNRDNYPLMAPYIPPAQMRVLYYELLEKFNQLLSRYNLLNQTCQGLLGNITNLQDQLDSLNSTCSILQTSIDNLQDQVDSLNSTLQIWVDKLQGQIDSLNSTLTSGQEAIINELSTNRNLLYIFTVTTLILIATTVYLAIMKTKIKPKTQ